MRGQLAKADLQRDEGGSRSPRTLSRASSQTSGPGSQLQANAPMPQCLWEVGSSWETMWMGRPVLLTVHLRKPFMGLVPPPCRNKAGLSLRRTCPTRHQGPSSCVLAAPHGDTTYSSHWGGKREDCASHCLDLGKRTGERTRTSRPAESEVRGWCPGRGVNCLYRGAGGMRTPPVRVQLCENRSETRTPSSGLYPFLPRSPPCAAQLV